VPGTVHTEEAARIAQARGQILAFLGEGIEQLRQEIPELVPDTTYHYATLKGQWSLHDLIAHLLALIGPAKVYLTTWTITEAPARALFSLYEGGYIEELHCLFDHRIKDGNPKPLQLLRSFMNSEKMGKCHAKTVSLVNEAWGVSVFGSANLSKNPRIERGAISTHRPVAEFDRDWILEEIKRHD
jgi:hypothetical protein